MDIDSVLTRALGSLASQRNFPYHLHLYKMVRKLCTTSCLLDPELEPLISRNSQYQNLGEKFMIR